MYKKYAIKFPELQTWSSVTSISPFSERGLSQLMTEADNTNNCVHVFCGYVLTSISNYVIAKNKTSELSKQIASKKAALDVKFDEGIEQEKIKFQEYIKRIDAQINESMVVMKTEMAQVTLELRTQTDTFAIKFEEALRTNHRFLEILHNERKKLEALQELINICAEDYSRRKEYIKCCEAVRVELKTINTLLQHIV